MSRARRLVAHLLAVSVAAAAHAGPGSGLAAHFPFDGNTLDASGNGNDATPVGTSTPTADRFGVANRAQEVRSTHYLSVADDPTLDIGGPLTIATWLKLLTVDSAYNVILGKDFENSYGFAINSGGSGLCPDAAANRYLELEIAGQLHIFSSGPKIECGTGRWYHLAVTFVPATDVANLYVDGTLRDTELVTTTVSDTSSPLGIGRDGTNTDSIHAALDDLRIYGRELSAIEIHALSRVGFRDGFETGNTSAWSLTMN